MRQTKHREEILQVLQNNIGAMSAGDIHTFLPQMNLTTIYRNLEGFTTAGIIKKMFLGDSEALYEYQRSPHHHAVCSDCKRVIHFTAPDEQIKRLLGITDFAITELTVMVSGQCTDGHREKAHCDDH
jgi:Fur family transcriptional regulator, peroxide stress response regulator